MKRLLIVVAALVLSGLADTSMTAQRPASTPTVSAGADYVFGESVRFTLDGTSATPLTLVTLFFRAPELPNTLTVDFPLPGGGSSQLHISHQVDLSQPATRLYPFTQITYWWLLQDAEGHQFELEPATLYYEDDQFAWRRLEQNELAVYWANGDTGLGLAALDIVADSLQRLQELIPAPAPRPLRVYLYPTAGDLRAALRLTGRDWVGGHASPELGVLLVTAVNPRTAVSDLRQSLPHELSHLLLYQIAGRDFSPDEYVPAWFDEGLATLAEQTANPNYELVLQQALATGATIPLADLCTSFPAGEQEAILAYAQSVSLLRYVQEDFGRQSLGQMALAFGEAGNCESGVRSVLNLSLDELDTRWQAAQRPLPAPLRLAQANAIWLVLILVSFLFLGLMVGLPWPRRERSPAGPGSAEGQAR